MVVLRDHESMENSASDFKSKDELESKKAQEVIGLLLSKQDDSNEVQVDFTDGKIVQNVSNAEIAVSVSGSSPLNISNVSLSEAGLLLESGDIIQQSLDGSTAIQLEDGATLIQSYEPDNECDGSDITAKFIDGQAVQLEDGTTAFIHAVPREGLQPVQLEDGTMAYLSQTSVELFNGEASSLDLENLTSSQVSDGEGKEYDKVDDSFSSSCSKGASCRSMEKAFRCPYEGCRRLYTTYHHLKVHERSHTGDRPFKCHIGSCTKAFATNYGLKSHIRVHTGETPYKCSENSCRKAFKTSGDLQKHLRTHTGERPFKCPYNGCDRAFTTSNIRKVHIRTHTGERPYVCKQPDCGRAFASATNYKNHIRIHTGEKPYVCSVSGCNKRFTEYSSLYKHHVVHTHSKPYICNVCGKTYRQTSTLAMHKRQSHGIVDSGEADDTSNLEVEMAESEKEDVCLKPKEEKSSTDEEQSTEPDECSKPFKILKVSSGDENPVSTAYPAVVALQGTTNQILQEQPVYVQVQEDGTLSTTAMQQIVLITEPEQLVALQQLAQQGQLESVLAITEQSSTTEES